MTRFSDFHRPSRVAFGAAGTISAAVARAIGSRLAAALPLLGLLAGMLAGAASPAQALSLSGPGAAAAEEAAVFTFTLDAGDAVGGISAAVGFDPALLSPVEIRLGAAYAGLVEGEDYLFSAEMPEAGRIEIFSVFAVDMGGVQTLFDIGFAAVGPTGPATVSALGTVQSYAAAEETPFALSEEVAITPAVAVPAPAAGLLGLSLAPVLLGRFLLARAAPSRPI